MAWHGARSWARCFLLYVPQLPLPREGRLSPIRSTRPSKWAELRERFEDMTPDEVRAAGYVANPPICVAVPGIGGMGIHAVNQEVMGTQFPTGKMDPENPR